MVILPDGVPCYSEYTFTILISNTKKIVPSASFRKMQQQQQQQQQLLLLLLLKLVTMLMIMIIIITLRNLTPERLRSSLVEEKCQEEKAFDINNNNNINKNNNIQNINHFSRSFGTPGKLGASH